MGMTPCGQAGHSTDAASTLRLTLILASWPPNPSPRHPQTPLAACLLYYNYSIVLPNCEQVSTAKVSEFSDLRDEWPPITTTHRCFFKRREGQTKEGLIGLLRINPHTRFPRRSG